MSRIQIAQCEFAFHRAFNRAAGRIKLAWFLLHAARCLPPRLFATDPDWAAGAVASHRALIEALRRGDVATVVALTDGEFSDGKRRLLAYLDQIGLWR